jgi:hypothetical protein
MTSTLVLQQFNVRLPWVKKLHAHAKMLHTSTCPKFIREKRAVIEKQRSASCIRQLSL